MGAPIPESSHSCTTLLTPQPHQHLATTMPKWRAFDEGGLTEGISGSILGLAMTPALSFVMTRVSSWLGPAQRRPQAMRWAAFRQSFDNLKTKWAKPLLTSPTTPLRYRYSLLATIAPDQSLFCSLVAVNATATITTIRRTACKKKSTLLMARPTVLSATAILNAFSLVRCYGQRLRLATTRQSLVRLGQHFLLNEMSEGTNPRLAGALLPDPALGECAVSGPSLLAPPASCLR